MNKKNIPKDTYEILPSLFNPTEFDAYQWVKTAKNAGMKYITITSRHHDGFSMFNSKASDYNIVSKTPYKKDILKELSEACQSEGIKLFFYYSLLIGIEMIIFQEVKQARELPVGLKVIGEIILNL